MKIFFSIVILFFLFTNTSKANIIRGKVVDQNDDVLPFVSIKLLNSSKGTITNENGEFELELKKIKENDSLVFSIIGYNPKKIALDLLDTSNLRITLNLAEYLLEKVDVFAKSAKDYFMESLESININTIDSPYYSEGYFSQYLTENDELINFSEAILKLYYPKNYYENSLKKFQESTFKYKTKFYPYTDASVKMLAGKSYDNFEDLKSIQKKIAKRKKKEIKKSGNDSSINYFFPGVHSLIFDDPILVSLKEKLNNKMDSYEYTFGNSSMFEGNKVITINIEQKKKEDYSYLNGEIHIDLNSLAIINCSSNVRIEIPFLGNIAVSFATGGLKVGKDPIIIYKAKYKKIRDYWYLDYMHININVVLEKIKWFAKNEIFDYDFEAIYFNEKIETQNVLPFYFNDPDLLHLRKSIHLQIDKSDDKPEVWEKYNKIKVKRIEEVKN